MKTGPQLTLEQVVLYQLCGDDRFYAALPPGSEDLKGPGKEAYRLALEAAMGGAHCTGCSSLSKAVTPFQNLLGQRLAAVQQANPELLEPLAAYIAGKRGYRPTPILLYYRGTDERISSLRF